MNICWMGWRYDKKIINPKQGDWIPNFLYQIFFHAYLVGGKNVQNNSLPFKENENIDEYRWCGFLIAKKKKKSLPWPAFNAAKHIDFGKPQYTVELEIANLKVVVKFNSNLYIDIKQSMWILVQWHHNDTQSTKPALPQPLTLCKLNKKYTKDDAKPHHIWGAHFVDHDHEWTKQPNSPGIRLIKHSDVITLAYKLYIAAGGSKSI